MFFTPINPRTWPRAQMFRYFSQIAPTGYSISVSVDVTDAREALKKSRKEILPGVSVAGHAAAERAARIQNRRAGRSARLLRFAHAAPENAYTVSCQPWVEFSHFAIHSYENKPYYFPSVEAGRFFARDGRTLMPLSLTCRHAATDGWHVRVFLDALSRDMSRPDEWL